MRKDSRKKYKQHLTLFFHADISVRAIAGSNGIWGWITRWLMHHHHASCAASAKPPLSRIAPFGSKTESRVGRWAKRHYGTLVCSFARAPNHPPTAPMAGATQHRIAALPLNIGQCMVLFFNTHLISSFKCLLKVLLIIYFGTYDPLYLLSHTKILSYFNTPQVGDRMR